MKKKFNKIEIPESLAEIFPIKVKFNDDQRNYFYDFSLLGDNEIHRAFAKVFYEKNSSLTKNTRNRTFGSINKFFNYLHGFNITKFNELNSLILASFATWLDTQKFSLNTKYHHYNSIENSLIDIKKIKNSPLLFLEIPTTPFKNPNSERTQPNKINSEKLKKILSICYLIIENQMQEFRTAQNKIIEVKHFLDNGGNFNWKDKYHIIYHFFTKYGYVPFSSRIDHHENEMFRNIGGVNILLNAITPDVHMLLPFYIILMFELAANSDALRKIQMNCVIDDPLFDDRCFIIWNKNRATEQQKRNVFKNKKFGAFQIINLIKEFTQHTRKLVNEEERNHLFICRGEMAKKPFLVPHEQSFKWAIDLFCKYNQLNFNFNPSDIRPSVLTELYKKSKDIVAVSKIANHKFIDTTLLYVVDDEIKKENRAYLSEKQNNIIIDILKVKEDFYEDLSKTANSVNVGFICKNPIIDKKVCINWMAELTNPELIIPANPIYLSRIIALKDSISKNRETMNKERFSLLYEPILIVINDQILTQFSTKLINEANVMAKKIKLPELGEY